MSLRRHVCRAACAHVATSKPVNGTRASSRAYLWYHTSTRSCASAAAAPVDSVAPDAEAAADALRRLASRLLEEDGLAQRLAKQPGALELIRVADEATLGREPAESASTTMQAVQGRLVSNVPLPSRRSMKIYVLQHFIPFVGFGFFDNAIMLLAGDFLDAKFGLLLGLSTLGAAAIGNTISDVFGLWIAGFIETVGVAMGFPRSGLTIAQRNDIRMRILKNTSMVLGITFGCFLGMFPLFFPDEWRLWEARSVVPDRIAVADLAWENLERAPP